MHVGWTSREVRGLMTVTAKFVAVSADVLKEKGQVLSGSIVIGGLSDRDQRDFATVFRSLSVIDGVNMRQKIFMEVLSKPSAREPPMRGFLTCGFCRFEKPAHLAKGS